MKQAAAVIGVGFVGRAHVEALRRLNIPVRGAMASTGERSNEATQALGSRFDIRAFHDELLGAGALPIDLLNTRVRAWIAAQTTSTRR